MITDAIGFVLQTALELIVLAALLRFLFQLFRVPFNNPLSEFVIALTNFGVVPLRKVVPGLYGKDLSSLAFAWIVEMVLLIALSLLNIDPLRLDSGTGWLGLALLALVRLLKLSVYVLIVAVFIQAILSWINPYHPAAALLAALTRPFLRPLQKRIPPVGNVDLTPLLLLVICQLIVMLPLGWLDQLARSMG